MTASSLPQTTQLFGGNSIFIEELYAKFLESPASVDPSWRQFFGQFGDLRDHVEKELKGAPWKPRSAGVIGRLSEEEIEAQKKASVKEKTKPAVTQPALDDVMLKQATEDSVRALMLIRTYRVRGHLNANLDPLGLTIPAPHPELDPAHYGFAEADLDRKIFIGGVLGLQTATVREILAILKQTYCGSIGVEFMHIQHPEEKAWIQEKFESTFGQPGLSAEEKKEILTDLIEVEAFEQFLQKKYTSTKRFSVQGGDAMVPALEAIIHRACQLGVEEIVMGMPHRGRMNVLTTVMKKPYIELLSIFHGNLDFPHWVESSGDVKYHLGTSTDREFDGRKVHLSLAANPSHLEAVNPVVVGKARAKQDQKQDIDRSRVMGLMLHGDAAFAGQGSVAEVLSLSELRGYRTGGSIHVIVNNQVGFTTSPAYARSSPYPTDVAKMVQAPIFHVNGDDPEAVVFVSRLAAEYRQNFKRDVALDITCFRKYGHNESDEPAFTQPIMYKTIAKKDLPAIHYAKKLVAEGTMTQEEVDAKFVEFHTFFDEQYEAAKSFNPNKADWLEGKWGGLEKPRGEHPQGDTGVDKKTLKELGLALAKEPPIKANTKILRQLEAKRQMMETGNGIDWATGEALAFASLLKEGYPVRLSGQDVGRGTFSHRHSVLVDQETEERYLPLNNLGGEQARYEVIDSNLSEYAVLGYEYGYSLAEPGALALWEAQFGDFANGAQVIIDQFISSAENKWLRMSGLVMLLPHGYEGQGPEHSSARPERYLQLCAEDNMQVANCSTPASYFHILRRQLKRNFRKPLIIMTPKSLLRHKLAVSKLDELAAGTQFKPVIGEVSKLADDKKIRRVVLCSGKVYYDLFEAREAQKINDVAVLRLEQFYPFPERQLVEELKRYKNAELVWCQEEPKNMGAWTFLEEWLEAALGVAGIKAARPKYIGRLASASTATGYLKIHQKEQQDLVNAALS